MKKPRKPRYVKCWVRFSNGCWAQRWSINGTRCFVPFIEHDCSMNESAPFCAAIGAMVFENPEIPKIDKVYKAIINQIKKEECK